jgi:hypothetical protein
VATWFAVLAALAIGAVWAVVILARRRDRDTLDDALPPAPETGKDGGDGA